MGAGLIQLRRIARLAVLSMLAAALAAQSARAHDDSVNVQGGTLSYTQIPGLPNLDNYLTITLTTSAQGTQYFDIDDPGSNGIIIESGGGCFPIALDATEVGCPAAGVTSILVQTGTGNDDIAINAPTPAVVRAGGGDDTIRGGSGPSTLYGEDGNDTLIAGPGGGNVLDGGPGSNKLYSCPARGDRVVNNTGSDRLINNCDASANPPRAPRPVGSPMPHLAQPAPTVAPTVTLSVKRRQRVRGARGILIGAFASGPGTVSAHGTVSVPGTARVYALKSASVTVSDPSVPATLRLGFSRKLTRVLRQSLAGGTRVVASVVVQALSVDGSASSDPLRSKVTLTR